MFTEPITKKTIPVDFDYLNKSELDFAKDKDEIKKHNEYKEQVGLQNYGFLISENRLCVSLSRQKKLLIVVGDSFIFRDGKWNDLAQKCVPGMWRLLKLCEREGVIVDGA